MKLSPYGIIASAIVALMLTRAVLCDLGPDAPAAALTILHLTLVVAMVALIPEQLVGRSPAWSPALTLAIGLSVALELASPLSHISIFSLAFSLGVLAHMAWRLNARTEVERHPPSAGPAG